MCYLVFNDDLSCFALVKSLHNNMMFGGWIPIKYIEEYKHIKQSDKDKYGNYLYKEKENNYEY